MTKLYAIAKDSRISAHQFAVFCEQIGAPYRVAASHFESLFDPALVEAVFVTEELAFDAATLAAKMRERLARLNIDVQLRTEARIVGGDSNSVNYELNGVPGKARWLFNCTYSNLCSVGIQVETKIKRELAELAIVRPPPALAGLGITVLDGPFFSLMPFPALGMYSLSHVRYTPHQSSLIPEEPLVPLASNATYMLRDAARFMPPISSCRYELSLFEIKAVIARNENDDGRPILIERNKANPRVISILGAKIDNIYDAREFLRSFAWNK